MSENSSISPTEVIRYLKLSRQMPDILQNITNQKIIEKTATEQKVIVSEQELQQAADRFRLENNLFTSKDTLKWLEKHGLSVEEFEESIKTSALSIKLAQHLFSDRVEAYFYEHQANYTKAVIYEIVLTDFNLAMELFFGIQEQEFNFWQLAHEYIQDDELRRRGGYSGIMTRNQLKPEISAAVFAANPPQILKPIAVEKCTHLIYVEEIIQPKLDRKLSYKIITQLFNNWLAFCNEELNQSSE
jgi:parvulin-like peptidyl-prolyl isomerase